MTKTRASIRLTNRCEGELKFKQDSDELKTRTRRRVKKPEIVFSDDSDNECEAKASNPKTKKEAKALVKKPVKVIDSGSDSGCRCLNSQKVKLSTPRKQKLQNGDNQHESSPPKQRKTGENNLRSSISLLSYDSDSGSRGLSTKTVKQKELYNSDENTPKQGTAEEPQTPSRLLSNLKLTSPKLSKSSAKSPKSSRKELFVENNKTDEKCTKKITTVYQSARKALHGTFPTDMPGRETELAELRDFIKVHIQNKTSGSLYISGPPGTGKTASLNTVLQDDEIGSEVRKVYVNCTAIKSPTAIYMRIAKELEVKVTGRTEKDYLTALENNLKKQKKVTLLVLDEIDQLESKNQSVLYTIFEWPSRHDAHLILIGIANALDLTDRTLPRLQARCELKPKLMHFAPYTKNQIVQILSTRLQSAGALEVFSPVALQMLAGKVAAVSGDVRRALDIGRRVVELIEGDVLKPVENLGSTNDRKTVELKQVVDILNSVYGTAQSMVEEGDDTFPLQQKIAICSLVLILKKARNKDVTIGRLHEVYRRVCAKRNLSSVDQAEFVGLCSLLEARGIVRVVGRKEPRMHKVNLVWDEEEVANALRDKQLMSMILQDEACLGKM